MGREKRIAGLFGLLMTGFLICVLGVMGAAFHGDELAQAAARQSTYQLTVSRSRGDFYDCTGQKLTGRNQEILAAVAPTVEAAGRMASLVDGEYRQAVGSALASGTPFLARVPAGTESSVGIDVFSVTDRYSEEQLASNLIGYVDGRGNGAAGLEKAFDWALHLDGSLQVTYSVDAVNRVLNSADREISDTRTQGEKGVFLTIDRRIQKIVEEACREAKLDKGAVVVLEVETGEIRALASLPSLQPDNIAEDLENPDGPLINKALSAYSVGSVFKLVSAAAALEAGITPEYAYYCDGSIEVDGQEFRCFDGTAHGTVTMADAISRSCNGYFVSLMQQVDPAEFLEMAKSLGFGQESVFAPGYTGAAGTLPTEDSLLVKRALANFSFGQGDLTATPVQVAAMTAAVASGGLYREPSLVKGVADLSTGEYVYLQPTGEKRTVMSMKTASLLRSFMEKAVEEGTAKAGKPESVSAGAKTGTAQTGQSTEEGEVVQLWYTGYFPAQAPRYVVTVLRADSTDNGKQGAAVFQKVADQLEKQGFLS